MTDMPSRTTSKDAASLAQSTLPPRGTAYGKAVPVCSVVVPCFNAAATIAATLDSASMQTLRNIEIIVVDDGSSDCSAHLIGALAESDSRISLIQQANGGVSAARNAGIKAAKARFIALLDADDLWATDHLQVHVRRLQNQPVLGVSYSPARFIDMQGHITGQSRPKLDQLTPADLLHGNPTTTCSTLVIRRDVFRDVGLFRTNMRHNEDQEWLFRVTLSGWVMTGDAMPRVDYRTTPGGLASDLDSMHEGFKTLLAEARKLAPNLVRRNETRAHATMLRYLARRAIRLGLDQKIARGFMLAALRKEPWLLLAEPRSTIATLAAALAPQAVTAAAMHSLRPRRAQA